WQSLGAVADQEGMFSMLPLSEAEVMRLRTEHAIYMPASGRINIAGLKTAEVAGVAGKFSSV
ncbi:aminotransferase class I/II-fold pyridoxal phosphate-dependent enzyme, partial [Sinorhizobium meliloti]